MSLADENANHLLALTTDEEKCAHLTNVFDQLPQAHRDCLEFLMFHLSRVAGRERENLVSADYYIKQVPIN